MKGRKPKDVGLKILSGNPGKRPIDSPPDDSDEFVRSALDKPSELDKEASEEWDRIVSRLKIVLTEADAGMVRLAATTHSTIRRCERILAKSYSYKTKNQHGQIMLRTRPEVGILEKARAQYNRVMAELGGSPVARTRVKTLPPPNQQQLPGMDRLLG